MGDGCGESKFIMLNTLNVSAIYLSIDINFAAYPGLSPLAFCFSWPREDSLANMGDEADPEIDFSLKKKKVRCACREHVHHPSPVLRSPQQ